MLAPSLKRLDFKLHQMQRTKTHDSIRINRKAQTNFIINLLLESFELKAFKTKARKG